MKGSRSGGTHVAHSDLSEGASFAWFVRVTLRLNRALFRQVSSWRLLAGILLGGSVLEAQAALPTVHVTVEVKDVDGRPIPGAEVGVGGGMGADAKNGTTDSTGRFAVEVGTIWGEISSFARCKGFYENQAPIQRIRKTQEQARQAESSGRWSPWELTIRLVLRPIKNPVPMYAKRLIAPLPVMGHPIGYDLEKGDWVAPYGKGARTDFEFLLEGRVANRTDYQGTLTLRLPGEGNGIQTYDYLTDADAVKRFYEAPSSGYAPTWTWSQSPDLQRQENELASKGGLHPGRRFIFRVRTVLDAKGEVVSAQYGKIYGPGRLGLRADGQWQIQFLYYLNPDGTRNLEFDPKRNLFSEETVMAP